MIATPTEITYFFEVYQTRHISKAALRFGVTQPTLTQSIQKLEEKLGASLFIRTKQGVIPTASATLFYKRAKQLQECWDQVQGDITSAKYDVSGLFKVGFHQSVAAYVGPPLIRNLTREAPGIQIKLFHDFSKKITERVVSYELDLGFVVNPPKHPDLVYKKLGDDRVTFWKKKGLTDPPKLIFADDSRSQVEDLLGKTYRRHFSEWHVVGSTSLELIRTFTNQGLGIGVLPERVAHAEGKSLEIYNPLLPSRPDEIFLTYRKEVLSSRAGKEFLRLASVSI